MNDRRIDPEAIASAARWVGEAAVSISEGALDLVVALLTMVLVERAYGQGGLGIYSYLLSVFVISKYLADFGVSSHIRHSLMGGAPAQDVLVSGRQAALLTGLAALALLSATAARDTSLTGINEKVAAYPLIGLAVLFGNINGLRIEALRGMGKIGKASAMLIKRRLIFLGLIFALTRIPSSLAPSYLTASFAASELLLLITSRRELKFPPIGGLFRGIGAVGLMLREGRRQLFSGDAIRFVFFVDFLVLGFFLMEDTIGAYAQASILGRFFLLLPVGIGPLLSRRYFSCGEACDSRAVELFSRTSRWVFYLNSVLALAMTVYFPGFMEYIFSVGAGDIPPLIIFEALLPGLLVYSAVAPSEALYHMEGRSEGLRRIVMWVLGINVALNFYLVPFARHYGAATATSISLIVYFFLFFYGLRSRLPVSAMPFATAGGVLYLCYVILKGLGSGPAYLWPLMPAVVLAAYYVSGFFSGPAGDRTGGA